MNDTQEQNTQSGRVGALESGVEVDAILNKHVIIQELIRRLYHQPKSHKTCSLIHPRCLVATHVSGRLSGQALLTLEIALRPKRPET